MALQLGENFHSTPPPTVQPTRVLEPERVAEIPTPAGREAGQGDAGLERAVGKAAGRIQQRGGADQEAAAAAERTEPFELLVDDRASAGYPARQGQAQDQPGS